MLPSDEARLQHIRRELDRILLVMEGKTRNDLVADFVLEHTVTRSMEIMGEASNKISTECKSHHPHLPWKDMTSMRNRIIHDYEGIDFDIIFNLVINVLPDLKNQLALLNLPDIPKPFLVSDNRPSKRQDK